MSPAGESARLAGPDWASLLRPEVCREFETPPGRAATGFICHLPADVHLRLSTLDSDNPAFARSHGLPAAPSRTTQVPAPCSEGELKGRLVDLMAYRSGRPGPG